MTDEQRIEFEETLSTVNDVFKDIQLDNNYQILTYEGKAKVLNKIANLTRNEKMLVAYLLGYSISEDNFDSVVPFLKRLGMSYNNAIAYLA